MNLAGCVLICEAEDWLGGVIAAMTGGPSHVALMLGGDDVLEARPPVVRVVPMRFYDGREWAIYRPVTEDGVPMTVDDGLRVAAEGLKYVGKPYSRRKLVLSAFAGAWQRLFGCSDEIHCARMVAACLSDTIWLRWRATSGGPELDPLTQVKPSTIARQALRDGWERVAATKGAPETWATERGEGS